MTLNIYKAEANEYAKYYAVYSEANIFNSFDWNEILECVTSENDYFIGLGSNIIGGFTLNNNELSFPFQAPPFTDKELFWKCVIAYAVDILRDKNLTFKFISERDEIILTDKFNAKIISTQRRMLRPTAKTFPKLIDGFYFDIPHETDKPEIIQAVYEAHSAGYTSTIKKAVKNEIAEAVNRRFDLFSQTDTLHIGTIVKQHKNDAVAGVCIAGIYPDSPNNFSTIHQVSVRPQFQRKGIAEAMMLNSIDKAHHISPVITLGVMVGNPAELLYRKIGFTGGTKYSELICTV